MNQAFNNVVNPLPGVREDQIRDANNYEQQAKVQPPGINMAGTGGAVGSGRV